MQHFKFLLVPQELKYKLFVVKKPQTKTVPYLFLNDVICDFSFFKTAFVDVDLQK